MVIPFVRSSCPIGLDVGERYIKAVQLAPHGRRQRVVAAASVERPRQAGAMAPAEIRQLRQKLSSLGFKGHSLVLAVPGEKLLTGIMELPPADSGAPIEMLARSELARMHKCDPQSFEMMSWPLPAPARAANTSFVMGAACTHANADSLLDCFENEGFRVERLEVQSQALARAMAPVLGSARGLGGILDIGWTAPRLVLLYDGVVIYERKLAKSAYGDLVTELADRLGLAIDQVEVMLFRQCQAGDHAEDVSDACRRYADRLADEMRIPLSYVSNQYPDAAAEELLLVGGGAGLDGLAERLSQAMNWPAKAVTLSDLAECPPSLNCPCGSALAAAAGLAWAAEE